MTRQSRSRGCDDPTVSENWPNRRLKAQSFFHKGSHSHVKLGAIYTKPTITVGFCFMYTDSKGGLNKLWKQINR